MKNKQLIGMVHCLPLLGAPGHTSMDDVIERAIKDAKTLEKAGFDAIMVENMLDKPLGVTLDFKARVALSIVVDRVCETVNLPVGIDAAFNDYEAALTIAKVTKASFIRIPIFVDTVIAHTGIISPCAREAIYYRDALDANDIKIYADIQVKHTTLLKDIPIQTSAQMAVGMGADVLIVTGASTGTETPIDTIASLKEHIKVPIFAGSGVDHENIKKQMDVIDGAIIGSSLKENKMISNPINFDLAHGLIKTYRGDDK
jgi:hypothetical protein